jgi:16S rRNA pseudouridine516 synthase
MSRLDKIISDSGVATRRDAELLIRARRVTVDGVTATSGAQKLDLERATVAVDGAELPRTRFCYIMMNKPLGYVSATEDRMEKPVTDLLTGRYANLNLFPAGRLDKDAEGLLLLTNDGDFAHRVITPNKHVRKRYVISFDGTLTERDAAAFEQGITLADGTKCRSARLEIVGQGHAVVELHEGKYHQVKRMVASRGASVTALKRVAVGGLELDEALRAGEFRELTAEELGRVFVT